MKIMSASDFANIHPHPPYVHSDSPLSLSVGVSGWIRSYCENGSCQVRHFRASIKVYDDEEKVIPSKLYCPLCGGQTSKWVEFEGPDTKAVAVRNKLSLRPGEKEK